MTSQRKVTDYTKQTLRSRPRRSPLSRHAKIVEALLELEPPEGLLIPIPEGASPAKFRRNIRAVVDRMVREFSSRRYRVSIADNGHILVGCFE